MPINPRDISPEVLGDNVGGQRLFFKAGEDIAANDLIVFNGQDDAHPVAFKATASDVLDAGAALWIAGERTPQNKYGVARYRSLLEGVTTVGATRSPVYLSDMAGGWSETPGTNSVRVGEILKQGVGGSVLLMPAAYGAAGGGGSPSTPSVGSTMVWAPGGGINADNQWEELSDIIANAPPGEGQVFVTLDFTAAPSETYEPDAASFTADLQRFEFVGGPDHVQVLPTIRLPAGCEARSPVALRLCRLVSSGGYFHLSDGARLVCEILQMDIVSGSTAPLQVLNGFNGALFNGADIQTGCLFVASGAALLGSFRTTQLRTNAIDDDGGTGTVGVDLDASCDIEEPQSTWLSREVQDTSGEYANMNHKFAQSEIAAPGGTLSMFVSAQAVNPSAGPVDVQLPPVGTDGDRREIFVFNNSSSTNLVRLLPDGTDTILGGTAPYSLPTVGWWSITLVGYGTNWLVK